MGGRSSGSGKGSSSEEDVVELTESNFKKLVMQSDDMWLVEFFAPWCGHCKVSRKELVKLTQRLMNFKMPF